MRCCYKLVGPLDLSPIQEEENFLCLFSKKKKKYLRENLLADSSHVDRHPISTSL